MFNFGNQPSLFEYLSNEIEREWQPDWNMREERQYRDDLIGFLDKHLNKTHRIRPEDGRGLADIGIDGKIGIELKLDLHSKSEINRLTGQVQDYLEDYEEVLVVLIGKVSSGVVRDVEYNMQKLSKSYEEPDPLWGNFNKVQSKHILVITKSPGKVIRARANDEDDDDSLLSLARKFDSGLSGWGL